MEVSGEIWEISHCVPLFLRNISIITPPRNRFTPIICMIFSSNIAKYPNLCNAKPAISVGVVIIAKLNESLGLREVISEKITLRCSVYERKTAKIAPSCTPTMNSIPSLILKKCDNIKMCAVEDTGKNSVNPSTADIRNIGKKSKNT